MVDSNADEARANPANAKIGNRKNKISSYIRQEGDDVCRMHEIHSVMSSGLGAPWGPA